MVTVANETVVKVRVWTDEPALDELVVVVVVDVVVVLDVVVVVVVVGNRLDEVVVVVVVVVGYWKFSTLMTPMAFGL